MPVFYRGFAWGTLLEKTRPYYAEEWMPLLTKAGPDSLERLMALYLMGRRTVLHLMERWTVLYSVEWWEAMAMSSLPLDSRHWSLP
jgi:hypothetical protein